MLSREVKNINKYTISKADNGIRYESGTIDKENRIIIDKAFNARFQTSDNTGDPLIDTVYDFTTKYPQLVFEDCIHLHDQIITDARTLPVITQLEEQVSNYYNTHFMSNLNNIYNNSPAFFMKNFLSNSVSFEKYQLYYYLLCYITYITENMTSEDFMRISGIDRVISWVSLRRDPNIAYIIVGPTDNTPFNVNYEEHYLTLMSTASSMDQIVQYQQLITAQTTSDDLMKIFRFLLTNPNVYVKTPDEAKKFTINIDSARGVIVEIDKYNNLVFDCGYVELGDTTAQNLEASRYSNMTFEAKPPEIDSRIATKKLENIFNQYSRLKIKELVFDESTFISSLTAFPKIFLVFHGIACSERAVYTSVNTSDLKIGGSFRKTNRGYEFVPDVDAITYRPAQTRVSAFRMYISLNPAEMNVIMPNEYVIRVPKQNIYQHPICVDVKFNDAKGPFDVYETKKGVLVKFVNKIYMYTDKFVMLNDDLSISNNFDTNVTDGNGDNFIIRGNNFTVDGYTLSFNNDKASITNGSYRFQQPAIALNGIYIKFLQLGTMCIIININDKRIKYYNNDRTKIYDDNDVEITDRVIYGIKITLDIINSIIMFSYNNSYISYKYVVTSGGPGMLMSSMYISFTLQLNEVQRIKTSKNNIVTIHPLQHKLSKYPIYMNDDQTITYINALTNEQETKYAEAYYDSTDNAYRWKIVEKKQKYVEIEDLTLVQLYAFANNTFKPIKDGTYLFSETQGAIQQIDDVDDISRLEKLSSFQFTSATAPTLQISPDCNITNGSSIGKYNQEYEYIYDITTSSITTQFNVKDHDVISSNISDITFTNFYPYTPPITTYDSIAYEVTDFNPKIDWFDKSMYRNSQVYSITQSDTSELKLNAIDKLTFVANKVDNTNIVLYTFDKPKDSTIYTTENNKGMYIFTKDITYKKDKSKFLYNDVEQNVKTIFAKYNTVWEYNITGTKLMPYGSLPSDKIYLSHNLYLQYGVETVSTKSMLLIVVYRKYEYVSNTIPTIPHADHDVPIFSPEASFAMPVVTYAVEFEVSDKTYSFSLHNNGIGVAGDISVTEAVDVNNDPIYKITYDITASCTRNTVYKISIVEQPSPVVYRLSVSKPLVPPSSPSDAYITHFNHYNFKALTRTTPCFRRVSYLQRIIQNEKLVDENGELKTVFNKHNLNIKTSNVIVRNANKISEEYYRNYAGVDIQKYEQTYRIAPAISPYDKHTLESVNPEMLMLGNIQKNVPIRDIAIDPIAVYVIPQESKMMLSMEFS